MLSSSSGVGADVLVQKPIPLISDTLFSLKEIFSMASPFCQLETLSICRGKEILTAILTEAPKNLFPIADIW